MTSNTIRLIACIALTFFGFDLSAQLTRGSVEYTGKVTKRYGAAGNQLAPETVADRSTCYFNDSHSSFVLTQGTGYNLTSTFNKTTGEGLFLISDPQTGKVAFTVDASKKNDAKSHPEITHLTETKKVCGYVCKGAKVVNEEGRTLYFWYTEEIKPGTVLYSVPDELPGICLEFTISDGDEDITYTATRVSDEVPAADRFKMDIPQGYELIHQTEESNGTFGLDNNVPVVAEPANDTQR